MNPAPRLDDQLCFALYTASRMVVRAYKPVLQALGLTYPQYLAMLVLWEWHDEGSGPHAVKDLGGRLQLDSGTLTPLLKRLEDRGLVTRIRSTTDERVLEVGLTDEGRVLGERAHTVPEALLCRFDVQDLTQVVRLREAVKKVVERLATGGI